MDNESSSSSSLWFQEAVAERFRLVDERHAVMASEIALLKARLDAALLTGPAIDAPPAQQTSGGGSPASGKTWRTLTRGV